MMTILCVKLQKNTIIFCANRTIVKKFAQEILNTVNGKSKNKINCDVNDVGKAKFKLKLESQVVIEINEQTIIICTEPAMVYRANDIKDIWFLDIRKNDDDYKAFIYPMTIFKDSKETWDKGIDEVYKYIIEGRYGIY